MKDSSGEPVMGVIEAPFGPELVRQINEYQNWNQSNANAGEPGSVGAVHPLTCGNDSRHSPLMADDAGLFCEQCDYKQDWIPNSIIAILFMRKREREKLAK